MDRQIAPPTAAVRALKIVAPIALGGTGASDDATAAANLGGIHYPALGETPSVLRVENTGQFDSSYLPTAAITAPQLSGDPFIYAGTMGVFKITNYDMSLTYTASVNAGSVSVVEDTISIVAPPLPQTLVLTINGRQVSIPVIAMVPKQPLITAPVDNAVNIGDTFKITSTAFATPLNVNDVQQSADWELALDSSFNNVVASSFNDTVNLVSWTTGVLLANQDYYVRTRHKGFGYGYSQWSPVTHFKTRSFFGPQYETSILTASDVAADDNFGQHVCLSGDGTRAFVGAAVKDTSTLTDLGAVYVFLNTGGTWVLEAKLLPSDGTAGAHFGFWIDSTDAGDRVIIGAYSQNASFGAAYVFSRTNQTWTQEQKLTGSDIATNFFTGSSVAIDSTGTRAVVGARLADFSSLTDAGEVYIFLRTGTTWAQEAIVRSSAPLAGGGFGWSCDISADGSRIIVCEFNQAQTIHGCATFKRSGTTWSPEAVPGTTNGVNGLGVDCALSSNGLRLAVASISAGGKGTIDVYAFAVSSWGLEQTIQNPTTAGTGSIYSVTLNSNGTILLAGDVTNNCVYLFTRTGSVWTLRQTLKASNFSLSNLFGYKVRMDNTGATAIVSDRYTSTQGLSNAGAAFIFN